MERKHGPLKKELGELMKRDLAGINVVKEVKERKGKVADLEQRISVAEESLTELRRRMVARLQSDRAARLQEIDKERDGLRKEKKRWGMKRVSAFAELSVIDSHIQGYDPGQNIGRVEGEYKDFFRSEVERIKREMKVDGLSLAAQETQLITEWQTLQNTIPGEADAESIIDGARKAQADTANG